MYKVIYITESGAVGEEYAETEDEAYKWDGYLMEQGCTTSIIKIG